MDILGATKLKYGAIHSADPKQIQCVSQSVSQILYGKPIIGNVKKSDPFCTGDPG